MPRRLASQPKGGFRPDLGRYFRSAWEANIARVLNLLKAKGEVLRWEYEAVEFWFPVLRGTRSFKPDFLVVWKDGSVEYWEVTGYETDKKRVALRRMRKYYPNVKIVVINSRNYQELARKFSRLVNWEE